MAVHVAPDHIVVYCSITKLLVTYCFSYFEMMWNKCFQALAFLQKQIKLFTFHLKTTNKYVQRVFVIYAEHYKKATQTQSNKNKSSNKATNGNSNRILSHFTFHRTKFDKHKTKSKWKYQYALPVLCLMTHKKCFKPDPLSNKGNNKLTLYCQSTTNTHPNARDIDLH